jgi:hypothetical protein
MNEPEPEQPPLTPDYNRERSCTDSVQVDPVAQPEAAVLPSRTVSPSRKAKPQPRHKRKLGRKRKPRRFGEWDSQEFRHDQQILDLQTRVLSLKTFLQDHDLWEVFVSQTEWW